MEYEIMKPIIGKKNEGQQTYMHTHAQGEKKRKRLVAQARTA